MKPLPKRSGARGRPRKKGKQVCLWDLFNHKDRFTQTWVHLYGKCECISYYCINLLWGQGLYKELRFVLVKRTCGEKSILVSTDLTLRPRKVIELYGTRFSIEENFREMKQQIGAFSYHFWTKYMPRLDHFAIKGTDQLSAILDGHARKKILDTVKAIESFVFCATVATGMLQMISLSEIISDKVTELRYLRTYSSKAPSEATVMYYLRKHIFLLLGKSPKSFITKYISEKQRDDFQQKHTIA